MLNSPMLSIFQHFHAIPLRSPLISLRSKWRLTGFSRRFTPKNPVRLHKPFGQLPRWGAKNVLPLNLIALPRGEGFVRRYAFSTYACIRFGVMGEAVFSYRSLHHAGKAGDTRETCHPQTFGHRPIYICGEAATTTLNPEP